MKNFCMKSKTMVHRFLPIIRQIQRKSHNRIICQKNRKTTPVDHSAKKQVFMQLDFLSYRMACNFLVA